MDEQLIVSPELVARRLRLPQPLAEDDRWQVAQAIADAQADLEAYLGRPVTPRVHTEHGLYVSPTGWKLAHEPLIRIESVAEEVDVDGHRTGRYSITYLAGLDGANDPELGALRRYVRVHAIYSADLQALLRRLSPDVARVVRQVSVEGQSVTYEDAYKAGGAPGSGAPGALPTLASCERWKRRNVFQRPTPIPPKEVREGWWPY